MGMFVNPDNSAFQVALNSEIYVDKTGLIKYTNKVLNKLQGYICNSCPRRFGKSVTANMLTAYYSRGCDSEKMFEGLEISKSTSKDDVLTYMIHLGYLGYNQKTKTAFVPNEEIRQELTNAVESKHWDEMLTFQQESECLLNATLEMYEKD